MDALESEDGGRSNCSSPIGASVSQRSSPTPLPAHMSPGAARHGFGPSPFMTPPGVKHEMDALHQSGSSAWTLDQPLDFSKKSGPLTPSPAHNNGLLTPGGSSVCSGDEPMDLSTHSRSSGGSSCESSPAPGALRTRGPAQPSPYALQLNANVSNAPPGMMPDFLPHSGAGMSLIGSRTPRGVHGSTHNGSGGEMVAPSHINTAGRRHYGYNSARLPLILPTTPPSYMPGQSDAFASSGNHGDDLQIEAARFAAMSTPSEERFPAATAGNPDYGMLRYKKEYQKFYNPSVGRLQCPFCKMLFKHGLKVLLVSLVTFI